jgi:hypothetical protein
MLSYHSPRKLTEWSSAMVRSRADEKFRVIDSELREYGVADARIAGPGNRIARWTPLIQPQTVYVDLDLEVVGQLSVGEAKERVLAVLNGAPDFLGCIRHRGDEDSYQRGIFIR